MIKLTEEELKKILELNDSASKIPVIFVGGRSMAASAWDNVRDYWDELGKKYDFNPEEVKGINRETGMVEFNVN
jgi:hypothetical protein